MISQMAAINNTVNDLRQIITSAAESNASKDSELRDIMTELRAQVEGQSGIAEVLPVMGEMVPVLQEMCADYAQQQNSVPGYGRQVVFTALLAAACTLAIKLYSYCTKH